MSVTQTHNEGVIHMICEKKFSKSHSIAITGGRILTMNPSDPEVEVVIFQNGRIIATGTKDILNSYPELEIYDLQGRALLPGFIDSHLHLSFGCFLPEWVDLSGCQNKEELFDRLNNYVVSHPEKEYIVGFPWFDLHYGGIEITKDDLDSIMAEKSVILIHTTFHSIVANTRACSLAGITNESKSSGSGIISKDERGELTGVLIETACIPVLYQALSCDSSYYADLIENAARDLLRFGITAVHDPGVTPGAEVAYKKLHAEQRLPVSVLMMPHGETLLDNRVGDRLQAMTFGAGDERLRVGPVKVFGDGANKEMMALSVQIQSQIYASGSYRDDFQEIITDAIHQGFQVCVHCLGNVTVDVVLDSFESAEKILPSGFSLRPRLEHVNLLSQEQIIHLASLGGCASVQPQFLTRASQLNRVPIEGTTWFAYGDLMKAGVVLGGSSDYPGGFMDGRDVIACCSMAATMSDGQGNIISPEQMMPFEKWLWIYTAGSAYVGNQEAERGMLREGLVADFVVLKGDLNPADPPIVDETWIGGKRVFSRSQDETEGSGGL
ncbi:MAG TPA: amidohydrolase [Methanospirillum sp.]|nr:amidohydrolase [Methanospirillum sp.]